MSGELAVRQAELVAALVAAAPTPPGFDPRRVDAARAALLRKRANGVARHWPLLAAGLGDAWLTIFTDWARNRPPRGSLRDGWDLARSLAAVGALPPLSLAELTVRESGWCYDGVTPPRRRRLPALRRRGDAVALQVAGRVFLLRWRR
ncbi:MAG TPA: hypothetical protein VFX61_13005 [Micromonosporaceae bacterium]|nr:hypothetical protein [Micromonosporaceae bacterium]